MVMKYIERPLTIYRRKWDMRQWVLVAGWNPLCVFMHRQSYARFAVEEYDETAQHQSADGGSDDDDDMAGGEDTSWALITMANMQAADAALTATVVVSLAFPGSTLVHS